MLDLAYCMKLPPAKAIAYLESKGFAVTWDWQELWQDAQAQAFTVAKVTRLDILQDIFDAVAKAQKQGQTLAAFSKELTPILQAKGWWGRKEHVDADGVVSTVQLGSPWRLETIYRVNLQTAYMAGRFQEQLSNVDDRPYWQYVAILDGRTRPGHRAMDGKIFRYDDPFWASFYPPNGWRCRCRVVALAERDLGNSKNVESSTGKLGQSMRQVSRSSDEMRPVATYRATDPATGKTVTVSPDVGWSYNPGAAAWQPDPSRYTGTLAPLAKKELK
ncbi:phage head morphogenesis protein [Undibacterium aquatile]|uniref:Minor capsid protein n=1 Tax=Undibacterium aquatile TaxID=1537398 RepID=A0ABR6XJL1_9BURK|nr:phage minor head protein [Undibacterium aquatile]MBC3813094.1 minor capsid protein [Undibacterium aquatile]